MKYTFGILALLIFFKNASGQEIKYINSNGFQTGKDNAQYYQEIFHDSIMDQSVLIRTYLMDGKIIQQGYFRTDNNHPNGMVIEFYDNGSKKYTRNFTDGILLELTGYYENGKVRRVEHYSKGKMILGKCYTVSGEDTAYFPVYTEPTFKGGNPYDVRLFIAQNLQYPYAAITNGIKGTVQVSFAIDAHDKICDLKVVQSDDQSLNSAALDVIKKSSKYWKTGSLEGKKVKSDVYTFPIVFNLK
jgi:TonB family protein